MGFDGNVNLHGYSHGGVWAGFFFQNSYWRWGFDKVAYVLLRGLDRVDWRSGVRSIARNGWVAGRRDPSAKIELKYWCVSGPNFSIAPAGSLIVCERRHGMCFNFLQ